MSRAPAPIFWPDAEPEILERDLAAISNFAPGLTYEPPKTDGGQVEHHGRWIGDLPIWPFDRPEPEGLQNLVPKGVSVVMSYSAAHPVLPPRIVVLDPVPELEERTQHRWHVAPGGSLCLLQTEGDWTPETSPVELLFKAAGWRIEYALMKAGVVDSMTTNGIVSDPARDHLIAEPLPNER
ncbi:hypothetical protein [Cellulosimicrobium cellulans]|uniref:Uncharacterized protein n=1 Tax=Cellulosimicrobium cellulans TaxID=1710 RepID=A0A4Y4DWL7_CELCE|nr:hypothetical protein [Cellulosimicrobium cellulans]GED08005.1 hypothetical protein CCE02nite_00040 [Cellulosimicrobium cellulans]